MNPFSKIVGGIRAVYRKADNAISKERDEEIREMVKAGTLEAIETIAGKKLTPIDQRNHGHRHEQSHHGHWRQ